jgi:hypothetical protein
MRHAISPLQGVHTRGGMVIDLDQACFIEHALLHQ